MMGRRRAVRSGGGTGDSGSGGDNTWSTQPPKRTVRTPRDIQMGESAAGLTRDILFGRTTQGMKLVYANAFQSSVYLYLVAAIGEGPVQRITPRLDDVPMTTSAGVNTTNPRGVQYFGANNYVTAWVYDGSQTGYQETLSQLNIWDPTWKTNTAAYDNLAFAVFKLYYDPTENSSIPKITFDVEGYRDVYDPRPATPTRGYSARIPMSASWSYLT